MSVAEKEVRNNGAEQLQNFFIFRVFIKRIRRILKKLKVDPATIVKRLNEWGYVYEDGKWIHKEYEA